MVPDERRQPHDRFDAESQSNFGDQARWGHFPF
jgi:hypothetical protein